jgi:serine/threonine protein kinase/ABC-type branched-subunit amino acid transport system substrate-binding protein
MKCPYCNKDNTDGVRYCSNCGKFIGSGPAPNTNGSVHSRALTAGSTLQGGRYVVKKVLGEGGMGAALLAIDKRLDDKQVVIKELISDSSDPEKFKEDVRNFKLEMRTLARLEHPLIPAVTDNFEENGHYYMVQEYVAGENLEERLDHLQAPMKERDVLNSASQVLDVLEYLAQETPPILHRDIKPANIIISDKDKRAHLVDFGIARQNVARKQTSALGTPGYAPPEQYQGKADPRSDLYALGATLHHLLSNRDPRNFPPFVYPPLRSVNPQVSAETERVITKAVNNDVTLRYQSATAMKHDIDDILLKRFGMSGTISSYALGATGSTATVPPATSNYNAPTISNQPVRPQPRPAPITPPPPVSPTFQAGAYAQPQRPRRRSNVGLNFALLILVILLLVGFSIGGYFYLHRQGSTTGVTPTPSNIPASGIGAITEAGGEVIGISDGRYALDTAPGRTSSDLMKQAAQRLQNGDISGAEGLWNQALTIDSSNAEALIYQEDQQVLASGNPYITIVVATMLSGDSGAVGVGRDDLQGAYVAQKAYNDGALLPNGVKVRLLVASSGSQSSYATLIAQQIVQLASVDKTVAGVMGWPYSSRVADAISVLAQAHIPMISQTASSDSFTNASKYFFRVAPPNLSQGSAGAKYAEQKLNAHKVVVWDDPTDPYSSSLAKAFSQQFTSDGNTILATETYTVGKPDSFNQLLTKTESFNPDLIYFSGYASDASVLLTDLPTSGQFANLNILGGDALYEVKGYQSSAHAATARMRFTTFAYPDEWQVLCASGQSFACTPPSFFQQYTSAFDPGNTHTGNPYGFSRADGDAILSYDATFAILTAAQNELTGSKTSLTPADLLAGLQQIKGAQAIQGVSGQIAFDSSGNPVNKAFVILKVAPGGFYQMDSVVGCFEKGAC